MKITKFKKVSKNKYKVYLDSGDTVSLYEDVIVNNNLLLTKEIDNDLLDKLMIQNNDVHTYGMALNYISIRIRSMKEIENYLQKKGISKEEIEKTIEKLTHEGYINDFDFAKAYVNDQLLLTPSGPSKIRMILSKFGITNDIIDEVMEEVDKATIEEKLSNLIVKQIKIKKGSSNQIKIKLLNYFINLGYEKYMILSELNKYKIKTDLTKLQKEYDRLLLKYKNKYQDNELKMIIISKLYSKGYTSDDISKIKTENY